ncbi:conjugal transfer protein [Clostridium niameyense]|uniref:Conjugal transfer protein n=1 Tax=Clostridium niameyense TaxID=1622073 RepID=A0A6M0R7M9_9CLOT|nr:cysteine-rich KTR domain-containing protein [Clostridium niameyense]NEZ46232.1 conjugal transfer protein [Clostridium niameyense]
MKNDKLILCLICRNKTLPKIRKNIILENFLLFCPKYEQDNLINVKQLNVSVIK